MTMLDIRKATAVDYGELFTLQHAAFVDEARLYDTPNVPALTETLEEFTTRLDGSDTWVAVAGHRIIGAVSLRLYRDDIPDVERLMVAPDRRGESISTELLMFVEHVALEQGYASLQLIVGDVATMNQKIYQHLGWSFEEAFDLEGFENVRLHNMSKQLS